MEQEKTIVKETSSLKLSKMSKGYNWEIKIYDDNLEELKKKVLDLDNWALMNWGGGSE